MNGIKAISLVFLILGLFNFSPVFSAEIQATAQATGKQAGKTLLTRGSVSSKRGDKNIALKRRSVIYEKDEIHVGAQGRAQFRMVDKALISLQENSVLRIKQYKFAQGSANNSALLELLSGGLRTVTGAIGKGNKKAYELRTPLATIGIRGTDYEVEIVSNGMFVAVWDGVIHLRSQIKSGCNMLLGRSQPYMFVFMDRLGKCKGLQEVPDVFSSGHSSRIKFANSKKQFAKSYEVGRSLQARQLAIAPLLQIVPTSSQPPVNTPNTDPGVNPDPQDPVVNPPTQDPSDTPDPVTDPSTPPVLTFNYNAFTIDQSRPSQELTAKSSALNTSLPVFSVGLNSLQNANNSDSEFQQSVGGYQVSWGYWGDFSSTALAKNISNSTSSGLLWAAYEATDPDVVGGRTGSFSRYQNITDSLLSGSQGAVRNLQVQMDVNFDSGNVTNGALSANTASDTWVAVFDGRIQAGDLDLQMNGASVIDSNPATPSPVRDVSGFIAGDFVGDNAEAILGAFGLSESANSSNHIEGVFVIEEGN